MGTREAETATVPDATEGATALPAAAAASPLQLTAGRLDARSVLSLQRTIGNAAVARLIDGEAAPATTGADAWTDKEVRGIQTELRRLGLYSRSIDGDRGPFTNAGLTEAFGSEAWQTQTATEAHEALRVAERPKGAGGTRLRYSELFSDGVLDVTFGVGYFEGDPPAAETKLVANGVIEALGERGYTEDGAKAAELLAKAGRPLADKATGRFFVKENHFTYAPPAGTPRPIHSIVRVVFNDVAGGGEKAAAAFREGMASGDATWYSGHGRYGTGPDFDRNFIEFRLYDADGKLTQTIDEYEALEAVLRREGKDPWQVFLRRVADGTIKVDLSNAGNVRIAEKAHGNEFGAKLIQWALDQSKAPLETGESGRLATDAAANPAQRYRVLAFYGCSTNAYDSAMRSTSGFGTKEADLLLTNRVTRGGADVAAFMAFLDGFVNQGSAEKLLGSMNTAMRKHESGFAGDPWVFTGLKDNPGR
jgi:hypothetical protein